MALHAKSALVTGCAGQDGSLLCEFLLERGYRVFGMLPHRNQPRLENLRTCLESSQFTLLHGDLTDANSLAAAVSRSQPDEVYNLGAQSFVQRSWELPLYTYDVTGMGAIRLLDAVYRIAPRARFYQASTSEMFGAEPGPQSETTPMRPISPYAIAKLMAHQAVINYRESYDAFACCGILFNHEGPRRGEHFVTQKIARTAAAIKLGLESEIRMGNINTRRDWGDAEDYVKAMWLMLNQDEPDDYVVGTGKSHSVREFLDICFSYLGLNYRDHLKIDPEFIRPMDVEELTADATKAREKLGWEPTTELRDLAIRMVNAQLLRLNTKNR